MTTSHLGRMAPTILVGAIHYSIDLFAYGAFVRACSKTDCASRTRCAREEYSSPIAFDYGAALQVLGRPDEKRSWSVPMAGFKAHFRANWEAFKFYEQEHRREILDRRRRQA